MYWGQLRQPVTIFRADGTYESLPWGAGKWRVEGDLIWFTEGNGTYALKVVEVTETAIFCRGRSAGEAADAWDRVVVLALPEPGTIN